MLGGALTVWAKAAGAVANPLGFAGVGLLSLGAGLIAALFLAGICWFTVNLYRSRTILLTRLEASYGEERRLIDLLRPHPRADLLSRARYLRLHAQLFDRIGLVAGLIGTAGTAATPLMKAWGDSKVLRDLFEAYQFLPAALALAVCVAAVINLGRARTLMRAASLYEEAAQEPATPSPGSASGPDAKPAADTHRVRETA